MLVRTVRFLAVALPLALRLRFRLRSATLRSPAQPPRLPGLAYGGGIRRVAHRGGPALRACDGAQRLRPLADRTSGDACFGVLREYTSVFSDPHLFVFESTQLDSAEAKRRAAAAPRVALAEAQAREYCARNSARLNPIDGNWYDAGLRVAVVPEDPSRTDSRFIAVVLSGGTPLWSPGLVRARFAGRPDGAYDVTVHAPSFAIQYLVARIHRRNLLRLLPGIWGKVLPLAPADTGWLDPSDPRRPTVRSGHGALVVSMPSRDPRYRRALDSLISQHGGELWASDRLIVDLRGNEGGASFTSNALRPYVVTRERRPTPYEDAEEVMLSTPAQIAYARRSFDSDTSAFVRSLVDRLAQSPGAPVPLRDPAKARPPASADFSIDGPRHVSVLVDGGTVRAAEVLVLAALRSLGATAFGEPTAGALDYQRVSIVRVSSGESRWFLGYPTIARSATVPVVPMRGRGIPPEVPLDLAGEPGPIEAVSRMPGRNRP